MGMEKLHPFDSKKFGKIYQHLQEYTELEPAHFYEPQPVTDEQLLEVHYQSYLDSLQFSEKIALISEMVPLRILPASMLHRQLLQPMRYATSGTLLAAELALEHQWAINLGGGFHHAKADGGEGFCFFADIPLAMRHVWKSRPDVKILVIDLDAHQGNGVQAIMEDDPMYSMLDVYNGDIYPNDREAKQFIQYSYPVASGIEDSEYLKLIEKAVPAAMDDSEPGLIIYNAGTDPYEGDRLGNMQLSEEGLILRDQMVFEAAFARNIPIMMVLSGGYSRQSGLIIGRSIHNVMERISVDEQLNVFHG